MPELRRPVNEKSLAAWVNEQIKQGTPRWPLYLRLSKMQIESDNVDEMNAFSKVMASIENMLVDRNLKGRELEKMGKVDEAITLYEANIADQFDGSHPYDRLRIIYESCDEYANAIRVCEAYINNGGHDEKLRKSFQLKIAKLKAIVHEE